MAKFDAKKVQIFSMADHNKFVDSLSDAVLDDMKKRCE